jgi:nicotinamide-nucleotide amidase
MSESPVTLSHELGRIFAAKAFKVVTAESCTGGWIAQSITQTPGSSAWFERGFIAYSNQAKQQMLGVKADTLNAYGAVSKQVAMEMAKGALSNSLADISVSVTGIAGPDGGTDEKPIGTVWIGHAFADNIAASLYHFKGDRHAIREQAVVKALETIIIMVKSS